MNKWISVGVSVMVLFASGVAGYAKLTAKAEFTAEDLKRLRREVIENVKAINEEIEEVQEDQKEIEKKEEVNQTEQKAIKEDVKEINIKQDRIIDLLLDMKNE